jgi:hypothetical protein
VLFPAAAAEARPGYQVTPPRFETFFFANATNGYLVFAFAERPNRVTVQVVKGLATATYELRGRVTENRIEANLGALGRISVGFRPRVAEGGEQIHSKRCKGRKSLNEKGHWVGTVEFHGELDFADASAARVEGNRVRDFRIVCKRRGRARGSVGAPPGSLLSHIVAASYVPGVSVQFGAGTVVPDIKPGPTWGFSASRVENFSRIKVTREVQSASYTGVTESAAGVVPVTATVEPGGPFVGSASFSQSPGQPAAWSGSLGVVLPGAGVVPLTGPAFAAALCRGPGEPEQRPCSELLGE